MGHACLASQVLLDALLISGAGSNSAAPGLLLPSGCGHALELNSVAIVFGMALRWDGKGIFHPSRIHQRVIMVKPIRPRFIFTLLLLSTTLVAQAKGLEGLLVLCQGEDGHFEIEMAKAGKCWECLNIDEHLDVGSSASTSAEKNHCGVCLDKPLEWAGISQMRGKDGGFYFKHFEPFLSVVVEARSTNYLLTVPTLLPNPPPVKTTNHFFLSTIRLII